jgi:peptidoglycan/LPS O-acetylase OafA/YrhL
MACTCCPAANISIATRSHFQVLDFLRGVAALCVLLLHWFDGIGLRWFGRAGLCVDFFFVLSGFVIAHSYADRLAGGKMSRIHFVWVRFVRLYPMVAAGVAFGLLRAMSHKVMAADPISFLGIIKIASANIFLLPALSGSPLTPGIRDGHIIGGIRLPAGYGSLVAFF